MYFNANYFSHIKLKKKKRCGLHKLDQMKVGSYTYVCMLCCMCVMWVEICVFIRVCVIWCVVCLMSNICCVMGVVIALCI